MDDFLIFYGVYINIPAKRKKKFRRSKTVKTFRKEFSPFPIYEKGRGESCYLSRWPKKKSIEIAKWSIIGSIRFKFCRLFVIIRYNPLYTKWSEYKFGQNISMASRPMIRRSTAFWEAITRKKSASVFLLGVYPLREPIEIFQKCLVLKYPRQKILLLCDALSFVQMVWI